jgi:hypothetical protein
LSSVGREAAPALGGLAGATAIETSASAATTTALSAESTVKKGVSLATVQAATANASLTTTLVAETTASEAASMGMGTLDTAMYGLVGGISAAEGAAVGFIGVLGRLIAAASSAIAVVGLVGAAEETGGRGHGDLNDAFADTQTGHFASDLHDVESKTGKSAAYAMFARQLAQKKANFESWATDEWNRTAGRPMPIEGTNKWQTHGRIGLNSNSAEVEEFKKFQNEFAGDKMISYKNDLAKIHYIKGFMGEFSDAKSAHEIASKAHFFEMLSQGGVGGHFPTKAGGFGGAATFAQPRVLPPHRPGYCEGAG